MTSSSAQKQSCTAAFFIKHAALFFLLIIDLFLLIYALGFLFLKDTPYFVLVGSPECALWKAHLYCIGCGGSRAVAALLEGDVLKSFGLNPHPIVWGFTLLYVNLHTVIRQFLSLKKRKTPPFLPYCGPVVWWAVLFSCLYFTVQIVLLLCGVDLIGDHGSYWPEFFKNLFS